MNRWIQIIAIIFLINSSVFGDNIWKITTSNGENLSCTQLMKISNDSLHTTILNKNRVFALQDITRISTFNRNVNKIMLLGAIIGGISGLATDTYVMGNKKLDIQKNGVLYMLSGLAGGTIIGHIISSKATVDLSNIDINTKRSIVGSMILLN